MKFCTWNLQMSIKFILLFSCFGSLLILKFYKFHHLPVQQILQIRQKVPFCDPHNSALYNSFMVEICDNFGKLTVTLPPWARNFKQPRIREMTILPEPKEWQSKSQYGEDGFVFREFFFGFEGGLIVESGALDGLQFSTSFGFVKSAHWKAVHVEANPENYLQLTENRPDAVNINAGLCGVNQSLHFVSDKLVKEAGIKRTFETNPIGTTPVSGFWEFMPISLKQKWWNGLNDNDVASFPATPCRSLSHLLSLFEIFHVDLWILDVEGAEASVLIGFDFSVVDVDVIGVELDGGDPEKDENVRNCLRRAGFQLHRRGHPYPYRAPHESVQIDNTGPSMLGLDNEWWISSKFSLRFEGMVRYGRGDFNWRPFSSQFIDRYNDSSVCCYSRELE